VKFPKLLSWLGGGKARNGGVLVVQSGSPELLIRVVDSLLERVPERPFTVLLQRAMEGRVPQRAGVEYIANEGPAPDFIRRLRAAGYRKVFVLYSNEPGYWKLKLLPFLLGGEIHAVNENLDWLPLDLAHADLLAQHLRWRLETDFAADRRSLPLELPVRVTAYPALLAYMAAYERIHDLTFRLRGGPRWKRENRPVAQ